MVALQKCRLPYDPRALPSRSEPKLFPFRYLAILADRYRRLSVASEPMIWPAGCNHAQSSGSQWQTVGHHTYVQSAAPDGPGRRPWPPQSRDEASMGRVLAATSRQSEADWRLGALGMVRLSDGESLCAVPHRGSRTVRYAAGSTGNTPRRTCRWPRSVINAQVWPSFGCRDACLWRGRHNPYRFGEQQDGKRHRKPADVPAGASEQAF